MSEGRRTNEGRKGKGGRRRASTSDVGAEPDRPTDSRRPRDGPSRHRCPDCPSVRRPTLGLWFRFRGDPRPPRRPEGRKETD